MLEQPVGNIVQLLVMVSDDQVDEGEEEGEPDQEHWHRQHPLLDWGQEVNSWWQGELQLSPEPASAPERRGQGWAEEDSNWLLHLANI